MSENVRDKKSSKLVIILLIAIVILLIAGIVTTVILLGKQGDGDSSAEGNENEETKVTIGYEGYGIGVLSEDELQAQWERMVEEAQEGMIDLEFKNQMISYDGDNFECKIGNAISNKYDMYANIYLDDEFQKQVVLTGLVPPGSEINNFKSEIHFDPGEYEAILVYTQVGDDHASIVGQTMLRIALLVDYEQ